MKKTHWLGLGLACLVASVAFAVTPYVNDQRDPARFKQTVTVLGIANLDAGVVIGSAGARITTSYTGARSWDFAAIGAGAINCEDSTAITVTGAALGDACLVSTMFGMDGGATQSIEASFSCYVSAANAAKVRACAFRADAGTLDLPDAGYFVRTFGR